MVSHIYLHEKYIGDKTLSTDLLLQVKKVKAQEAG